jgi:small subunit ribosomal protein S7e
MSVENKILRTANAPNTPPTDLEKRLAQAYLDLEGANVGDMKGDLRPLQISAAREIDVKGGKKAIVIFVPVPQLKGYRRLHARCAARFDTSNGRLTHIIYLISIPYYPLYSPTTSSSYSLTRELEKKFSERHVVFVAQRRTLPKPTRNSRVKQKRPRSRTLTDVHDKILEDLVYPTDIVGKRTRVGIDGSKLLKV